MTELAEDRLRRLGTRPGDISLLADLVAAVRPMFDVFDPDDGEMPMDQYNVLRALYGAFAALEESRG